MKYGQLPSSPVTSKNGITLNQFVEVDMSPANLKKHGLKPKRGWNGIYEFRVTHLFDDYFVGLTGSLQNMCIPYSLIATEN